LLFKYSHLIARMPLELVITSLVSLFSGLISLHINPEDKKYKIWRLVLVGLLITSSVSAVYFGYQKEQESKATEAKKDSQIEKLSSSVSQLNKQNTALQATIVQMQLQIGQVSGNTLKILERLGWKEEKLRNPTEEQVNRSLQATQLLNTVVQTTTEQKPIVVQYFPKDVDPTIVNSRLEALGNVKVSPTRSQLQEVPTNAIWLGSEVDINTAKAVAYTLIGAGVEIKIIRRFSNSQGRERVIQVGGDVECINRPPLTVEAIRDVQQFPLQREVVNCQATF